MDTFHVLVLICGAAVHPGDCNVNNAIDVMPIKTPTLHSAQQCMFMGMAGLAPTAVAPRDGEYSRVVCTRELRHHERGVNGTIVGSLE